MGDTAIKGKADDVLAARLRVEAERARKRAAIQSKIDEWKNKLTKVQSQQTSLTTQQTNLNTYLGEWDTQKTTYNGNDILKDVVIINVFEGVCADNIKTDFTYCITQMDKTYGVVSGLNAHLGEQIGRLNQYKSSINAQLSSLEAELRSI